MPFWDLPLDPSAWPARKKAKKKAKPAKKRPVKRRKKSAVEAGLGQIPREAPRRVLLDRHAFARVLRAGDWPGGSDRKPFKHQGKTYTPWIVLQHVVTAIGPREEVVEFVEAGSPVA